MASTPLFSVIIPTHNAGDYLRDAVESVMVQDFAPDFEILIVNDHSTDSRSIDVLKSIASLGPMIRVLDNRGVRGPAATRNVGIMVAKGEWLAFLDADDIWPQNSLRIRIQILEQHPEIDWIAGDYRYWLENGSLVAGAPARVQSLEPAFLERTPILLRRPVEICIPETPFPLGCVFLRASLVRQVGGFNETLWYGEDWYLWLNLAVFKDLIFVPETVLHVRRHGITLMNRPESLTSLASLAPCKAFFDRRLRKYRRTIRWKIISEYRLLSRHNATAGNQLQACKFACLALLWGLENTRQWKEVGRLARDTACLLRKPSGH
ncbi:MAG: glycosyltransferase [Deltaproteobacteria bacterium]|nr:glycosyltransferase [Deltaproteobacteria bacterium]